MTRTSRLFLLGLAAVAVAVGAGLWGASSSNEEGFVCEQLELALREQDEVVTAVIDGTVTPRDWAEFRGAIGMVGSAADELGSQEKAELADDWEQAVERWQSEVEEGSADATSTQRQGAIANALAASCGEPVMGDVGP